MDWIREIRKHSKYFINDLTGLLQIPSIKNVAESKEGEPFGKEISHALNYMLELGKREGFRIKNLNGYAGYIEYGPINATEYIGVLCHIDVVPANGEWNHDPFEPHIEDGKIFARGSSDDKGPTMAAFYALKQLKKSEIPIKHRIRIIIGTDEESGMSCMDFYYKQEPPAFFGFAPDARFPIINAEKGQYDLLLDYRLAYEASPIHLVSFNAGDKENMVPDKAEAIINGDQVLAYINALKKEPTSNMNIDKVENGWKISVIGKSAHGATPFRGKNAAFLLADTLKEIPFPDAEKNFLQFITRVAKGTQGAQFGIDFQDEQLGGVTVHAGIFKFNNTTGGTITLNLRYPISASKTKIINNVKAVLKAYHIQITELKEKKPHYVEPTHPGIQLLKEVYEEQTGEQATLLSIGGATYARFIASGVAFGAIFPKKTSTAHQVNEYAPIEDLYHATSIYTESLKRLGNMVIT